MSKLVIDLERVRRADVPHIGTKAANLSRLARAGYPVPPGQCITTHSFWLALGERRRTIVDLLHGLDGHNPEQVQTVAAKIARHLKELSVPAPLSTALERLIRTHGSVAVRSSSTAEDQATHSFAGVYTTTLGVQTVAALQSAVLDCWCSFYSPAALAARAHAGATEQDHAMALLVQPLVKADCAGVCFSVDPVASRRDRLVVTAAWGLGSGIVDGQVVADAYWFHRRSLKVEQYDITEKVWQVTAGPHGGSQLADVPAHQRRAACLPEAWARRLAEFAVSIENLFGMPQDIEWAIADQQLWILQSRPITTLARDITAMVSFPTDTVGKRLWSIMNDDGLDPGPLLPLEQDALLVAESIRAEACRFMAADRNQAVQFFNGRPYRHALPLDLSQGDRRIRRQAIIDLQQRLHSQNLSSWDYWGPEIIKATERLALFDVTAANGQALADHLDDVLAARRRHMMLHPLCSFSPPVSYFETLREVTGEQDVQLLAYQLIDGTQTPLTDMIEALETLAQSAPAMVRGLIRNPTDDILGHLAAVPEAEDFLNSLKGFLSRYGERTGDGWGSEARLTQPTWRERPQDVCHVLEAYLHPEADSPAKARAQAKAERERLVEDLCERCTDPDTVARFRQELTYARKVVATLEFHNHYIDQLSTGQMRRAVMAAANWLVGQRAIPQVSDIFYLSFEEIQAALRAISAISMSRTIARRRHQFQHWARLEAPPIVGLPDPKLPERPPSHDEPFHSHHPRINGLLTGQGASPGRREGRARVMLDETAHPSQGDILVARNIGPRWTPYLPMLAAIVLDGGGIGQHAATTAREYGIPAVIATGWATQRIVDGTHITVDGTHGTVEFSE